MVMRVVYIVCKQLKPALCSLPVLKLPNFTKLFFVKSGALYVALGAVLL